MSLFSKEYRPLRNAVLIIMALGCLLFIAGIPYGLGFLAGALLSVIMYEWNVHYWNGVLDTGQARRFTGFPHFMINFALMGGLMILSVKFPKILNIFCVAAGLMTVKSAIIVEELCNTFIKKRGGKE